MRKLSIALLGGVGVALVVGATASPAFGQEALPAENAPAADVQAPPEAEAPLQFEVGPTVSSATWETVSGRPDIANATMLGLSVESVVANYFGIRFDAAYGTPSFTDGTAGGGSESVDVHQYFVDVSLVARLGLPKLREIGVVPFATIGLGSVVHDPKPDDLTTRSQSAWEYGAGIDLPLRSHLGARLEWRRAEVSLEDLFDDGTDRTGRTVSNDRFTLGAYVRF